METDRMAAVENIFIALAKRQRMRELEEVCAIGDRGLENCVHGRAGSRRQVLLMEGEILAQLGLAPGVVRENITTRGLRLGDLRSARRLRIGEAVLEVTTTCEPCERMEEIREGLRAELEGRRGILCRVIESGMIRRGSRIEVLEPAGIAANAGEKGGRT